VKKEEGDNVIIEVIDTEYDNTEDIDRDILLIK
jgi:hypothetical protein